MLTAAAAKFGGLSAILLGRDETLCDGTLFLIVVDWKPIPRQLACLCHICPPSKRSEFQNEINRGLLRW
jgi:hypothetical protein